MRPRNVQNYQEFGKIPRQSDPLCFSLLNSNFLQAIYSITGRIFCNNIKVCKSKQKEITSELKILFGDQTRFETLKTPHPLDETGNSFVYENRFTFKSTKNEIAADIYQWTEKMKLEKGYYTNVKVDISKAEFVNFLKHEAYK